MDVIEVIPRIRRRLELSLDNLPHFTTVCHAKERLYMPNWRMEGLDPTSTLQELGEVQAIDASRTDYTFEALETTLLVDCASGPVLDVHCSTKQPHDTYVARQLLARNFDRVETITAD